MEIISSGILDTEVEVNRVIAMNVTGKTKIIGVTIEIRVCCNLNFSLNVNKHETFLLRS